MNTEWLQAARRRHGTCVDVLFSCTCASCQSNLAIVQTLKMLVLDEADKLLDMDFEKEIDQILSVIPRDRRTLLFSATMTSKVQKLQRASLRSPVKVGLTYIYMRVYRCAHRDISMRA